MSVSTAAYRQPVASRSRGLHLHLRLPLVAGLLLLPGCVDLEPLIKRINDLTARVDALSKKQDKSTHDLDAVVLRAFCPPEIGELVKKVQKACEGGHICKGETVSLSLLSVDPTNKGHFITLMQTQPHVALYLKPKQTQLTDQQRLRLRALVRPPWFDKTNFLIVAHPDPNDGENMKNGTDRASLVRAAVAELKFPSEDAAPGYVSPPIPPDKLLQWVFSFSNRGEKLESKDQPNKSNNETLVNSVWVFRVDC